MDIADDQFDTKYTQDESVDMMENTKDGNSTPSEAFNDEISVWARRAFMANGFGDY